MEREQEIIEKTVVVKNEPLWTDSTVVEENIAPTEKDRVEAMPTEQKINQELKSEKYFKEIGNSQEVCVEKDFGREFLHSEIDLPPIKNENILDGSRKKKFKSMRKKLPCRVCQKLDQRKTAHKMPALKPFNSKEAEATFDVNNMPNPTRDLDLVQRPSISLDDAFKKEVLRQFSILNYKLDFLSDLLTKKIENIAVPEDKILDKFNLPINSIEDLAKVEAFLIEKDNNNKFAKELARIGGSTYKVMSRSLMEKLFTNQFAMTYSWFGLKGKSVFSTLNIAHTITESIHIHHKAVTTAEIEASVKQWLVKAKERNSKVKE